MTDVTPPKKAKTASLGKHYFISIIAFILAIAAMVLVGILWQQQGTVRSASESQIAQLQQSITELKTSLEKYQQQTQEMLTTNQKNITQLMGQTNQTSQQQAVVEASYLIRLANLHLTVENNLSTGIQLLKMAQHQLQSLTAPDLNALKQAINTDIRALSAVPQIDRVDLVNQIDSLSSQVADLPTQPQLAPHQAPEAKPNAGPSNDWWGNVKHNLSGLKDLFVVRRVDRPFTPLLHPQQILLFKETVRFKLLQAQWALLHQYSSLYQQSLSAAAQLLSDYNQHQSATATIIKKLRSLAIIDIKPQTPPLQSWRVLESLSFTLPPHKGNIEGTIS